MERSGSENPLSIDADWSHYVQSPAQLAFSRLNKFPPGSEQRLADIIGLEKYDQILEIGCGMGILSGRLLEANPSVVIWGCELDATYLKTDIPSSLTPDERTITFQATGFNLPIPDNYFDKVISHTVVNLLQEDEWEPLHDEIQRVLKSGGSVTHMDGIGGTSWCPPHLEPPEAEKERSDEFFRILDKVHTQLDTGFVNTVFSLPERLDELGFDEIDVDSYSSVFRINDSWWNENQRKVLLELWQRAERDRIERLRNLIEATDEIDVELGSLFRESISDVQQQALRRRKALENNRELGWRNSTTLVVSGTHG